MPPPVPSFEDSIVDLHADDPDEALYCLKQLLKILNKNISYLKNIGYSQTLGILDRLLVSTEVQVQTDLKNACQIKYLQILDIFQEAEAIRFLCAEQKNKKVAVVARMKKLKNSIVIFSF